jgi:proteic killer suppression protein
MYKQCTSQSVLTIKNAYLGLFRVIFPLNCPRWSRRVSFSTLSLDNTIAFRYYFFMIKSLKCKETEKIFKHYFSRKLPRGIQRKALEKMWMIDVANKISDLSVPPGNRLEALKEDRKGQHSIRINDQWRICFEWKDNDAYHVEITDYH